MNRTVEAHAKINLYLDITGKRENGYHDIKGIMHKISLSDTVSVTAAESEKNSITVSCSVPSIPLGESNIAYKAAMRYSEAFSSDKCYDIHIHIEKRIPAAGGLAGGSTDAAAVLLCLFDMLGGATKEQIHALGAGLGADVPFCLYDHAMITEGIGDILTPCPSLSGCCLLICNTGEAVSTPEAYRELDALHDDFKSKGFDEERFSLLLNGLESSDPTLAAKGMFNIFEDAVLPTRPKARHAKQTMLSCGAVGAMMSGSGPTIFGIFDNEEMARAAYDTLLSFGYVTHLCTTV